MLSNVRRILVLGCPGSGKSMLAQRLGVLLGLPVVHLDHHYWKPDWQATPADEWDERLSEMLSEPRWVIDGMYFGHLRSSS